MNNPFIYRSGVDNSMFFGRKKEINSILSRLSGKKPLCISVTGLRRIGKTSLLRVINTEEFINKLKQNSKNEYLIIYLDFQKLSNIDDIKFFKYVSKIILNEIRRNYLYLSEGNILDSVESTYLSLSGSLDLFDIKNEFFENIIKIITKELQIKIILLLDEFESAMKNMELETFDFLRAITAEYNISYVTATRKDLQYICKNADLSGFHNIFSLIKLSLFEKFEARQLLTIPLKQMGVVLKGSEIELSLDYVGFHPFFIQLFGYHIVDNLKINRLDLNEVKKHFYIDAKPIFEEIFESLDNIEKEALIDLVNDIPIESTLLNSLKDKGILNNDFSVFSKSFLNFLLTLKRKAQSNEQKLEVVVWKLIEKVELGLRKLIKEKFFLEYKENWENRILKCLHKNQVDSILERRKKAKKKYILSDFEPSSEIIDYTYIGQLSSIINTDWNLFQDIFGNGREKKRQLREKLDAIIIVRNDRGHFNKVPENELKRVEVFCNDILIMIRKYLN